PASRNAAKFTPFTTRDPSTSRQGMIRRARLTPQSSRNWQAISRLPHRFFPGGTAPRRACPRKVRLQTRRRTRTRRPSLQLQFGRRSYAQNKNNRRHSIHLAARHHAESSIDSSPCEAALDSTAIRKLFLGKFQGQPAPETPRSLDKAPGVRGKFQEMVCLAEWRLRV